jgi:branched-chain amino acid transport system ATP-binding protein
MTDGLEVRAVTLRFGGITALHDVDLIATPGEVVAVIGPNGAGKTSMLNAINGLVRPTGGSIRVDGREVIGRRPTDIARMGVARTFQSPSLFGSLDVEANLMMGRHLHTHSGFIGGMVWLGRSRREQRQQRAAIEPVIELLDLGPHCGQPVDSLPYGVQRRIGLARAVVMEPRVLLLDEPAAGTDVDEREAMIAAIRRVSVQFGPAIVLVEHDLDFVDELASRALVLDFGSPIAFGSLDELRFDVRVLEAYLGDPT